MGFAGRGEGRGVREVAVMLLPFNGSVFYRDFGFVSGFLWFSRRVSLILGPGWHMEDIRL